MSGQGRSPSRWFRAALIVVVLFAVFHRAFLPGSEFAFRDGADFYPPLLRYVSSEWKAGRAPLWNPYHNLGVPLAASGTAAAFYPGTVLFLLPIPFGVQYKLYVFGHLLLAAVAVYWLARRLNACGNGATLAALAYAFSGTVLFQHANVVFLVGAAWLPLALRFVYSLVVDGRRGASLGLAFCLAMVVLGGDPQSAYHAVLAAVVLVWLAWRNRHQHAAPACIGWPSRLLLLGFALVLGGGLAAVQILPSMELAARSDRTVADTAGSVWEVPSRLREGQGIGAAMAGFVEPPTPGSRGERTYQFSLGPWRLAELIWPNVFGRQFPTHSRWIEALPAEGRVWTPSIYFGLLPLVLAWIALGFRGETTTCWLSWLLTIGVVASFGYYGLGWLFNEAHRAVVGANGTAPIAPQAGGVYWLMATFLPGYGSFRYPAKLFSVATLAASLLAARAWPRMMESGDKRIPRVLACLAVASAVTLLAAWIAWPWWPRLAALVEPSPLFGPFDASDALRCLVVALASGAVLAAGYWLLLRYFRSWPRTSVVLLLLTALDLTIAQLTLDTSAVAPRAGALGDTVCGDRGTDRLAPPARVHRPWNWLPARWKDKGDLKRLGELLAWQRMTLGPNHHLDARVGVCDVADTLGLFEYDALSELVTDQAVRPPEPILQLFGIGYCLGVSDDRFGQPLALAQLDSAEAGSAEVARVPGPTNRAWIVHRAIRLDPLVSPGPAAVRDRSAVVMRESQENRQLRDFRSVAVLEAVSGAVRTGLLNAEPHDSADLIERCRVVEYAADRVVVEAVLVRPGVVVLAEQFYPGWSAQVHSAGQAPRSATILRTNRVLRGVCLPSGEHRLEFNYRPPAFLLGRSVAALAWLTWAVVGLLWWRRPNAFPAR